MKALTITPPAHTASAGTWASEWRLLARDRLVGIALVALLLVTLFAAYSGAAYRTQWQQVAAQAQSASRQALDEQIASLRDARSGVPAASNTAGTPSSVRITMPAAVPPLAHFSLGQSDLYPRTATASMFGRNDSLFSRTELQSPLTLASGRFDLGFVIVAILPLLAIVLCFDLLSADRASGRLALLAVQAGALRGLLWRRLVLRAALLAVPLAGLLLWGIASAAPLLPLVLWCALAALYALFWLLLCAWIAVRPRAPETQAAQLVALWLLLVLAVPAAINRLIETLAPPPSQQSFRVEMRAAEIEANRRSAELMRGFLHDHPELTVQGPEQYAAWMKTFFVSQRAVDERTGELLAAHEAQRVRADRVACALQFLSPAAAMQLALTDAAGTGAAQQAAYVAAARSYQSELLQRVSPALFQAVRLNVDQLRALPAFVAPLWTTAHGGTLLGAVFVYLTLACGALVFAVTRAAHRLSPLASEFETRTVRRAA